MSFMVQWPDGGRVFISGANHSAFTTYKQLEDKATTLAKRVGGKAFYENGNPRLQADGTDPFPRRIPLGRLPSQREEASVRAAKEAQAYIKAHST